MVLAYYNMLSSIQSGLHLISQAITIRDRVVALIYANQHMPAMFQLAGELVQSGTDFCAVFCCRAEYVGLSRASTGTSMMQTNREMVV